ncbi:MAG: glycoside hydrolase family 9 protein [Lachnospiraceae bacterium]|nr:glycoside hydrolase family 9 protein [Lachnospiraceae bacterium]
MKITVDQIGYLPEAAKIAVADHEGPFYLENELTGEKSAVPVSVRSMGKDETAGETVWQLDFSDLREPGCYLLKDAEGNASQTFKVEPHLYKTVKNALLKAFYFQRCGMELEKEYASVYTHPACHEGGSLLYEDQKITLDIQGGWHDAGDFGRYVSAGAVAVAHLLYAYELFPEAFEETVNIPESGNGMPDVLNECRYELEWMLQMQREDGGVYHKQTTFVHADFIMPQEDREQLYIFPVSSMATGDFAALMCLAARVYKEFDPAFARDCMHAGVAAGMWLLENPDNTNFKNPEGSNTGEYDDDDDRDERMWAFAELIRTDLEVRNAGDHSLMSGVRNNLSRQARYKQAFEQMTKEYLEMDAKRLDKGMIVDGFGWTDCGLFAMIAAIFDRSMTVDQNLVSQLRKRLYEKAELLCKVQEENGYHVAMGMKDFCWGSNMVVHNRAGLLIVASLSLNEELEMDEKGVSRDATGLVKVVEYGVIRKDETPRLSDEERSRMEDSIAHYEACAKEQVHYILGRNANDISYITRFGGHAFNNPHNRPSACDHIDAAIPGQVSGGPCYPPMDAAAKEKVPEGAAPQKCYVDDIGSYSTNEIAIYWNSTALFTFAYLDL